MTIILKNKYTLQLDEFKFKCCIGKKGSTSNKKEGDKKTPKGTFKIENLYFREDRVKKPLTLLKCIKIKKDMGWCDDISFPKKYNKLIKIKKKREGDKKTPKGTFNIESLYYRKDRLTKPKTSLNCIEIKKTWAGVMILNSPKNIIN